MKTVNVRFITHHKVNGGPDDYEREWMAECDVEEQDAYVEAVRVYDQERYDAGEKVELSRKEWGKEIEAKIDKVEARALEFWRGDR